MKKINVGVIGLGVGRYHALNILENKSCHLSMICDKKKINSLKLPNSLKKIKFTRKENEILENKKIDLVCISSYDNFHFDQIVKAINYNKHIFVEKPICLKQEELNYLKKKLSKHKNIKISTNLVLRNNPYIKKMQKLIKKKKLGDLYYVEAEYNYGRIEKITKGWRGDIKNYSIILGGGIHIIDIIQNLFGEKFKIVNIEGNKIVTKKTKFKNLDFVTVVLKNSQNLIVKLNFNFGCVMPHSHIFRVYGTNGSYFLDNEKETLYQRKEGIIKKKFSKKISTSHIYKKKILKSFINNIKNGSEPIINKKNLFQSIQTAIDFEKKINLKK